MLTVTLYHIPNGFTVINNTVPRVVSEVWPVPLPGQRRLDRGGQVGRRQQEVVGGRARVELVVVVDADVVQGRRVRGAGPGAEARGRRAVIAAEHRSLV